MEHAVATHQLVSSFLGAGFLILPVTNIDHDSDIQSSMTQPTPPHQRPDIEALARDVSARIHVQLLAVLRQLHGQDDFDHGNTPIRLECNLSRGHAAESDDRSNGYRIVSTDVTDVNIPFLVDAPECSVLPLPDDEQQSITSGAERSSSRKRRPVSTGIDNGLTLAKRRVSVLDC